MTRVGFIGVGNLGHPICARLIGQGHRVAAFDADGEALAAIVAKGASSAASCAGAAAGAEVVFTCLPSPAAVSAAVTEREGVLAGARPGTIIVDLSTNEPNLVRALAEYARASGVAMVDAPVAGGVPAASAGTLTIMVGGTLGDFERVRPLLECLGSHLFHLGPVGSGSIVKIANNLLAFCNLAAAGEAFMAVSRGGVSPELFLEVLETSSGGSTILERFRRKILRGDFRPEFALDLAYKDVSLGLSLGEEFGVPMLFAAIVQAVMQQARASGYGADDCCAIVRVLEDIVGETVRAGRTDAVGA